jgi:hypothetical protein
MKRHLFVLLIFLTIFTSIYSQEIKEDFELYLNYGSVSGEGNIFSNEYDLSAFLIKLFIVHNITNIGFETTPLKYVANYSANMQRWDQNIYFLNGNIYWNIYGLLEYIRGSSDIKSLIIGPFASINYLNIKNWSEINANKYVFSYGLRCSIMTYISLYKNQNKEHPFQIIGSEIGFKNISGEQNFYINVNIDILMLAAMIAVLLNS